ncbi:hypothetical protein A3J23_02845 [Candidatus Peregrinibacteria bacterium RIFCSPLOWO2_02_FULL_48_14]|nr:MAG: hypothetical protein A3J23_02845 [Candidatus Peregrinibacteria bacterium RIFCSPLOWO2_02_FULL_48_14]
MEKRLLQLVLVLVLVFGVWNFWRPFWRYDLNEAADKGSEEKIIFDVEKGSGAETIAENLEDENLIVSEVSFVRTVEEEELDGSLRYGRFVLSSGMTLREIITVLTTQGTGEMAITVLEGWTIEDIDAELVELGLAEAGTFKTCAINCKFDYVFLEGNGGLEGFLFPDTYFIDSANFTVESFTRTLLENFDAKWTDEMQAAMEAESRSIREMVIVASMIEKEVRTEKDLSLVSGIIWKRLDNDWMLGIDATLLYTQNDGELSPEDLANDNPYNTRLNTGLPPTAIGNPGLASLQAALVPEISDYWFYLTDDEGDVHYAVTNEEHEANKAEYL